MARLRLPRRPNRPRSGRGRTAARLLLGAILYALAELAAGILIGRFFDWGRAEALLFFAFRPWLLLIAAFRMAEAPWRRRLTLYALALAIAGLAESLLLLGIGASDPWPEMSRGLAAGVLIVLLFDLGIQIGCRLGEGRGKPAATILLAGLMLVPGALRSWERLAIGATQPAQAAEKPPLTVMTSLPIIWGETGPFDPGSRPAASWLALQQAFTPEALDYLDARALAGSRLMLLAQPRQLAPEELVALDSWVRRGGPILILADPALLWPTELPPGDVRGPVSTNMLAPLLAHWGVSAESPERPSLRVERVAIGGETRQLQLAGAGRLQFANSDCRQPAWFVADCRIGDGRAMIVADSDLLHDSTSLPPGAVQLERHNRVSDNIPAIVDWLDRLARLNRQPVFPKVQWADPDAGRIRALLLGAIPILAALLLAILAGRPRRPKDSPIYPQDETASYSAALGGTNRE